jgi:hypothetical protein
VPWSRLGKEPVKVEMETLTMHIQANGVDDKKNPSNDTEVLRVHLIVAAVSISETIFCCCSCALER